MIDKNLQSLQEDYVRLVLLKENPSDFLEWLIDAYKSVRFNIDIEPYDTKSVIGNIEHILNAFNRSFNEYREIFHRKLNMDINKNYNQFHVLLTDMKDYLEAHPYSKAHQNVASARTEKDIFKK